MRIWESLKALFFRKASTAQCTVGNIYHIHTGTHRNKFIILVNTSEKKLSFLLLPEGKNLIISYKDYNIGIESKIIEYVETLPRKISKVCKRQYEKNEYADCRR